MSPTSRSWWKSSAIQLGAAYRSGATTPVSVLQDCFSRIDEINPRLNALIALRRSAALEDAVRSAKRFEDGAPLSPLDGVPLVIKDNLFTHDMPTTWGSVALADYRTPHDELAVARARAAGAIVLGKANVPEYTLEGYTSNRLFGTTRNPWNPALTPGGSSGGAVSAVAAGFAPLALGTDGGGSIRRPASHTGLVGFKPSIGAVARDQVLPPLLLDFEVVGPIARSSDDARLLFDIVRGPSAEDRRSLAAQAARKPLPARLRVLYVPTLADAPVDPQIASSCRQAALRLQALGAEVQEGVLPLDLDYMTTRWPIIGQIGLAALFESHPHWRSATTPKYLEMADKGAAQAASLLWSIFAAVEKLRSDVTQLFQRYDLIVTPSAAALPWTAEEAYPTEIAGQAVGQRGHAIFTAWVNAAGLPALALPAEPSAEGLPIGIQLIGDFGSDDALLSLGAALESGIPDFGRFPPI